MQYIQLIDSNILFFIQNHIQNPILNPIMIFFTDLGNVGFIWFLICFILLIKKKYRKVGILVLCALLVNLLLGEVFLKNLIQRPRPFETLVGLHIIITKPSTYSFPSGHTSSAFACAFMLGYFFKKYKWYFYALASLIGFSRVYLLVHYPSDVICGVILGFISYLIVKIIYLKFSKTKAIKCKQRE